MLGRVMETLHQFTPWLEVYSIDEAFMDLSHVPVADLESYAQKLKATVQQWPGIPISIGIGSTKTQAKLANKKAKGSKTGILDLGHRPDLDGVLAGIEVGEIRGIGRRRAKRLRGLGIYRALDLKQARPELIRQKLGVVGERKQSIMVSRSGRPVTCLRELTEAVATYLCRAVEKVQGSLFEWQKVQESRQLMQMVDEISQEWGSETLRFAVTGVKRAWQMQAAMRSPRFTTQWGEIPVVRVG